SSHGAGSYRSGRAAQVRTAQVRIDQVRAVKVRADCTVALSPLIPHNRALRQNVQVLLIRHTRSAIVAPLGRAVDVVLRCANPAPIRVGAEYYTYTIKHSTDLERSPASTLRERCAWVTVKRSLDEARTIRPA